MRKNLNSFLSRAISGLIFGALLWSSICLCLIWVYGTKDTSHEKAEAIVILGCHVNPGGEPSPTLEARVLKGLELFKEKRAPLIYLAGGVGNNPPAEAEVMKKILVGAKVPEDSIVTEMESKSTNEQAVLAAENLLPAQKRVIIVTDFFHLWRAVYLFNNQGFDATGSPALESPLYTNKAKSIYYTVLSILSLTKLFAVEAIAAILLWIILVYFLTRKSFTQSGKKDS